MTGATILADCFSNYVVSATDFPYQLRKVSRTVNYKASNLVYKALELHRQETD